MRQREGETVEEVKETKLQCLMIFHLNEALTEI